MEESTKLDKKFLGVFQSIRDALVWIAIGDQQGGNAEVLQKIQELETKVDGVRNQQEKMMADLTAEFAGFGTALDRAVAEINSEITDLAAALASNAAASAVVEDARAKIVAATGQISGVADALAADNPPAPPTV